jgi:hypothetical protein
MRGRLAILARVGFGVTDVDGRPGRALGIGTENISRFEVAKFPTNPAKHFLGGMRVQKADTHFDVAFVENVLGIIRAHTGIEAQEQAVTSLAFFEGFTEARGTGILNREEGKHAKAKCPDHVRLDSFTGNSFKLKSPGSRNNLAIGRTLS